MKRILLLALIISCAVAPLHGAAPDVPRSKQKGCNGALEGVMFKAWKLAAGNDMEPSTTRAEKISFSASDGVHLGGYHLPCTRLASQAFCPGTLLFVQGNAIYAGQVVNQLAVFADKGFDVYVYDFRGYGISGGKSRSADIISDYKEIIDSLSQTIPPEKLYFYGGSLGGMILTDAIGTKPFSGMVLDSVLSRVPWFCSTSLNPEDNLPADDKNVLMISGTSDTVVPEKKMEELINLGSARQATVWRPAGFHHIFLYANEDQARFIHAISFFETTRRPN